MISGKILRDAIISGANNINNQRSRVDELNVFPVPDGDTGTNMGMTVGASVRELEALDDSCTVAEAAKTAASAMLRGARGNSGVITSLLFRGFSKALEGKKEADVADIVAALQKGVEGAYKAVMKPTEGTILTVARVASEKAAASDAAEAQMFFAARDPSSAGIANEAFRRLWHLLRKLPLYELLLRREDAPSCFTSDEDCREMWDEMMTRGTQAHDDYAHWIARLSRIGQDLSDFRRNTQWMLSAYFEGLPSCKRENYIDAYGRFKDGIRKAKLADIDEESDPFYDPPVASFRFDFPAHISFIPYRDEKTGKPKMAERSTFDDLIAFFYLDLTRGIAAGNLPRRCKNCGHWFVAVGGYNTQYCDRPILGQHGKTCRSVGAHETAKRKLREAAAKEYARTYNRLKGRKQRGTISTDEWNRTVAVAEELRAAFQAGEMAESEYCRKLKAL